MSTSKSPDIKKPQREVLKSGKSKAVLISIRGEPSEVATALERVVLNSANPSIKSDNK